jgi:hypothetical protein
MYTVFPASFVQEAVFSPMHVFGTFVENQMATATWVHFWVLYSVPLVHMSVFMPIPCCFVIMDLLDILKSAFVTPPAFPFLLRITLAVHCLLCFHMNFGFFSYFCEECH